MTTIYLFALSIFGTIILDYLWIGILMKDFYLRELGTLARTVNGTFSAYIPSAFSVYVLMALGLIFFVLPKVTSIPTAFGWGALFGLILYGVYDFTNHATLQGWSYKFMIVDILWGAFLCGIITTGLFIFSK